MYGIFILPFALASVALASTPLTITNEARPTATWAPHPTTVEARATDASIPLPTTTSATPSTPREMSIPGVTATPTTTAAAPLNTRAPQIDATTLMKLARPTLQTRGTAAFVSDYDGHIITVRPSIIATTIDYHGNQPLMTLTGNRCPGCDRVLDPYDDSDWNGRYGGEHWGYYDPNDDGLYWGRR